MGAGGRPSRPGRPPGARKRAERDALRAAARAQRDRRREASRAKRREAGARRAAQRRARFLRNVVLLETALKRLGRFLVPAHTRRLPRAKAILVLALNVAPFPGLGTALYGKWERGLAQFLLTFVFLVGWLWAIADGVRIVHKAFSPERRLAPSHPVATPMGTRER